MHEVTVAEFALRSSIGGVNLCIGATASASATYGDNSASKAIDGDPTTYWRWVNGDTTDREQWLEVLLPAGAYVIQYSVTSSPVGSNVDKTPLHWFMEYWDVINSVWVISDDRTVTSWSYPETKTFSVAAPVPVSAAPIVTTGTVATASGNGITGPISLSQFAGGLVAGDLVVEIATLLGDEYLIDTNDYVRWQTADLLGYLHDACMEVINLKPQSNVAEIVLPLVSGTRQLLPDPIIMLRTVVCNLNSTRQAGSNPPVIDADALFDVLPNIHSDTPGDIVSICGYSHQAPKVLYVYPPQPVATDRALLVSVVLAPLPLVDGSAVLPLGREYGPALVDYVCYRCYQHDTEAGSAERSAKFLADFSAKIQAVPPR